MNRLRLNALRTGFWQDHELCWVPQKRLLCQKLEPFDLVWTYLMHLLFSPRGMKNIWQRYRQMLFLDLYFCWFGFLNQLILRQHFLRKLKYGLLIQYIIINIIIMIDLIIISVSTCWGSFFRTEKSGEKIHLKRGALFSDLRINHRIHSKWIDVMQ